MLYLNNNIINTPTQIHKLTKKTQLPTTITLITLNILPKTHPLSLNILKIHNIHSTNYILQKTNLLIILNTHFNNQTINKTKQFYPNTKIIHININHTKLNKIKQPHITIQTNINNILTQLIPLIKTQPHTK